MATVLATMGENFDGLLRVTIAYPRGVPILWCILSPSRSPALTCVKRICFEGETIHWAARRPGAAVDFQRITDDHAANRRNHSHCCQVPA